MVFVLVIRKKRGSKISDLNDHGRKVKSPHEALVDFSQGEGGGRSYDLEEMNLVYRSMSNRGISMIQYELHVFPRSRYSKGESILVDA